MHLDYFFTIYIIIFVGSYICVKDLLKYWNSIELVFVYLNGNHRVKNCEFAGRSLLISFVLFPLSIMKW
jgi:hypothetical protein